MLIGFLQADNFLLSHVNLVLILLHLVLALLEHFLLVVGNVVKLFTHLLNLLSLGMVDVRLTSNLLLTGLDICGCIFVLLGQLLVVFAALCELDLDVS